MIPIFPVLELESVVQENDKTRLDASKTYLSAGSVLSKVEIQPGEDADFIDVTNVKYLDWQFEIPDGADTDPVDIAVTLRVTSEDDPGDDLDDPQNVKVLVKNISVVSESVDHLFSTDDQIRKHENEILKYVPDGRATFKDVHRRAQTLILAWLDTEGYIDDFADKLTVARIKDINEVTEWSAMMALRLIFEGISNAKDDVFLEKSKRYLGLEAFYRGRAVLRVDLNKDGVLDLAEQIDIRSAVVVRR